MLCVIGIRYLSFCSRGSSCSNTQQPPLLNAQKMIGLHSKTTVEALLLSANTLSLLLYLLDLFVSSKNSRMLEAHKRRGASAIEKPLRAGCTLITLEHPSLLSKSLYLARYLSPQFTQPIRTCGKSKTLGTVWKTRCSVSNSSMLSVMISPSWD